MIDLSHHIVPVHVIGRKNSGKTTLICELVRELCSQGYRVGSIKHTSHTHEFDSPGKDSQRHRVAGAAISGIVSSGLCAAFWPTPNDPSEDNRYARLLKLYDECDLVLVEGDTLTSSPKIEVWRAVTDGAPLAGSGIEVQAVVTDEQLPGCPAAVWPRSDVVGLARRVLNLAGVASPPTSSSEALSFSRNYVACDTEH